MIYFLEILNNECNDENFEPGLNFNSIAIKGHLN